MPKAFGLRILCAGADKGLHPLGAHTTVGRGRAAAADLCVDEPSLSGGRHFAVVWDAAASCHRLVDFGHPNGLWLNGVPVERGSVHPLRAGDEISVGQRVFRYEVM